MSAGGIFIGLPQLVASVGALAAFAFLYWFITRTETGMALQATAQDRQAASLMGIDTERMFAIGWGIGAACVGVAGALLTMFFYVFPEVGGSFALLAYVAVALGGFGNVPATLVGGVVVGLVEVIGGLVIDPPSSTSSSSRSISRSCCGGRRASSAGSRQDTARVRLAVGLGVLLVLLAFPLVVTQPFPRHVFITIFLYATLARAWNLLAGYCGQISLGHAVFFGTGAYTSSMLVKTFDLTPWAGMVAGALLAVALSQAIGYPVFRLHGHYFAIATIAVGEIVHIVAVNWDWIGAARGLFLPIKRPDSIVNLQFHQNKQAYYYIALGLLLLALAVTRRIERSRTGYYFRAIREDAGAAASLGIPGE